MNKVQYLLCKLAEEASEVSQIALKSQQFGLEETYIDESNRERICNELNDLLGVVEVLNKYGLHYYPDEVAIKNKEIKMENYFKYSKECNQTQGDW